MQINLALPHLFTWKSKLNDIFYRIVLVVCIISLFKYILKQLFTSVSVVSGGYLPSREVCTQVRTTRAARLFFPHSANQIKSLFSGVVGAVAWSLLPQIVFFFKSASPVVIPVDNMINFSNRLIQWQRSIQRRRIIFTWRTMAKSMTLCLMIKVLWCLGVGHITSVAVWSLTGALFPVSEL